MPHAMACSFDANVAILPTFQSSLPERPLSTDVFLMQSQESPDE